MKFARGEIKGLHLFLLGALTMVTLVCSLVLAVAGVRLYPNPLGLLLLVGAIWTASPMVTFYVREWP